MLRILFWVYIINAILLISHEMDSAYQQEWKLFKMAGGINLFLILHFPILFAILYGLIELEHGSILGLIISFGLGIAGVIAFFIHLYFIRKGNPEFKTLMSQFILVSMMIVSILQLAITIFLFVRPPLPLG